MERGTGLIERKGCSERRKGCSQSPEYSFGGVPTTYYDLFRVENGFIAEHWDVMETLAAKETWQNQNGKF